MPITFGSVGDIISVSLLIKDLVKSLNNSRGSSAEYQAVIRELWSLDHALLEVEVLLRSCQQTVQLNALSATVNQCAEQCRKCITTFYEHMKKFENGLKSGGSGSFFRDAAVKVRWQVSEKEDLAKFRAEINTHCLSINMLLTTAGVTLTELNENNFQASWKASELSHEQLSATQAHELAEIKRHLAENNALIKTAASETKESSLGLRSAMEYLKSVGTDILSLMQKICKVNFLTYKAVISLQTSIPNQLERCWTQQPAILEDALGRVTPLHLEFLDSWEAFEAVLEVRFRQLPGHRKIKQREYALRNNALERDVEKSLAFTLCFLPGKRIDMSMIFDGSIGGRSSCPGCQLVTSKTEEGLDSQVQCPRCKIWYQRVVETSTTESKQRCTIEPKIIMQDNMSAARHSQKRQRNHEEEIDENPSHFRRVRLRYSDQSVEPGSVQTAQETDISLNGSIKASGNAAKALWLMGRLEELNRSAKSADYEGLTEAEKRLAFSTRESLKLEFEVTLMKIWETRPKPESNANILDVERLLRDEKFLEAERILQFVWGARNEPEYNKTQQKASLLEHGRLRDAFEKQGF
ncbi:hypothetical protein BDR22DRAFT_258396 [Usnea florida]